MLAKCVNDDTFVSLESKSKHQLWLELCDIITRHPKDVTSLKVDAILRSGIRKFTDEARAAIKITFQWLNKGACRLQPYASKIFLLLVCSSTFSML